MTNIALDDTRFIFATNFAGDPSKDKYGDDRRKCNIVVPAAKVQELLNAGVRVRETRPREGDEYYTPEYFITAQVKYRKKNREMIKFPPKVYLVSAEETNGPVLLNEENIGCLDNIRVKNVNVILVPFQYDPDNGSSTLYIRTMYVEQDDSDDPYAARYRNNAYGYDDPSSSTTVTPSTFISEAF